MTGIEYLRCPYCGYFEGMHGKKPPRRTGYYRVKMFNNTLIFNCNRCGKSFRHSTIGSVILWADMTKAERGAFRQQKYREKQNGK